MDEVIDRFTVTRLLVNILRQAVERIETERHKEDSFSIWCELWFVAFNDRGLNGYLREAGIPGVVNPLDQLGGAQELWRDRGGNFQRLSGAHAGQQKGWDERATVRSVEERFVLRGKAVPQCEGLVKSAAADISPQFAIVRGGGHANG